MVDLIGNEHSFYRLAPFIQEYIYTHSWTELRPVQIEACRVIFDTDAHLLLAAGTASGKTEAAFLPVLTLLHEQPATTIGVLYVGPIKALINDQFERLSDLLQEADIPVWHWHGDVSQSRKKKLLKDPKGILQITPESLESLLINKKDIELVRLFGDLRFVIIDEIHAFMGSERGCQILCQLARLSRFTKNSPRRIGLSATLGDYSSAAEWLRAGTERSVITSDIRAGQRKLHLAVEHFYVPDQPVTEANESVISTYYRYIFNHTKSRNCLIFANNRTETESVIATLRHIAEIEGLPDIYHVHHGSISARLREAAENAMRDPTSAAVTAATLTLELGIDIGQLERVIQLEAPLSVSSFLQRLGRSGRRGEPADMRFVCTEDEPSGEESLPKLIPWQLLQAIAIIQLYLEERWIEPIQPVQYPMSLLYHQTMSILAAGELSPAALASKVLTLPPFAAISKDDFRQLLRYLIDIDHIQQTEQGGLIIGLTGEKIVRSFQFYAVFADNKEYVVRDDSMEIGSIVMPLPPGNRFTLAGRTWEVLDVEPKAKTVWVKRVEGVASVSWRGGSSNIHTKVLERMRQVLFEDVLYSYLQDGAKERLKTTRQLARNAGLDKANLLPLEGNTCCVFPWMGTVAYRTLERLLNFLCRESLDIRSIDGVRPYFLTVQLGKSKPKELHDKIVFFCKQRITAHDLVSPEEAPKLQKYDEFIPPELLRKAFALDYLNVVELGKIVGGW